MAMLPNVFVPEEAEDNPFAPIPEEWYPAEIIKSDYKATNAKDGHYIALNFKVLDGDHANRLLFANLNIDNKSDVAVKIGRADLKAICKAVGLPEDYELEDTTDLHNIPILIKVTIKAANANWPAKNEIKGYKHEGWTPGEDEEGGEDNPF